MPRYRVEAVSWIGGRTVRPGEEIEFAGIPGTKLEPLDDEAKAAKKAAEASRAQGSSRSAPSFAPVDVNPPKRAQVEIPSDWEETLRPEQRISLARQLGAPAKGTTAKVADTFIKAEIANRATV